MSKLSRRDFFKGNGGNVIVISGSSGPIFRGGSNHAVNSKYMKANNLPPYDAEKVVAKEYVANLCQKAV